MFLDVFYITVFLPLLFTPVRTRSWNPFGLVPEVRVSGEALGDAIYGLKIHALVAIKEPWDGSSVSP